MATFKLVHEIIALSEADTWEQASSEWRLSTIYMSEARETCLCGHYPIKQICIIENRLTHKEATVGNCCVAKFKGIGSGGLEELFASIRKLKSNPASAILSGFAIEWAHASGLINDWERGFYLSIRRIRRRLSPKQAYTKEQVNRKVLSNVAR